MLLQHNYLFAESLEFSQQMCNSYWHRDQCISLEELTNQHAWESLQLLTFGPSLLSLVPSVGQLPQTVPFFLVPAKNKDISDATNKCLFTAILKMNLYT